MTFKKSLLAGASVALLAAAFASPAAAVTWKTGGSSLIAPYISQIWASFVGSSSINNPPTTTDAVQLWDASVQHTIGTPSVFVSGDTNKYYYLSSNSLGGLKGFYTNSAAQLGTAASGFTALTGAALGFGFSDLALTSGFTGSDVDVFANGGTDPNFSGISFVSSGQNNTTTFLTPALRYGGGGTANLIQIPVSIDPVALVYSATYDGTHNFNINTNDGFVHLDKTAYCKILNGIITDWNDSSISALNVSTANPTPTSLTGGNSATIHLVGRTTGSGTTSIFNHHLADVCSGIAGNKFFLDPTNTGGGFADFQTLPAGLSAIYNQQGGSGGVATAVDSTPGALGYIGADFAVPANSNTHATAVTLNAISLQVGSTSSFAQPTAADAVTAFGTVLPPQSNSNGTYNAGASGSRAAPADWVPFVTNPSVGYPMIGTTNVVLASHYPAGQVTALVAPAPSAGFLTSYYDNSNTAVSTILGDAALGRLPAAWNTAITQTFVTDPNSLSLNIH